MMFAATLIQPGHTWIDVILTFILMLPGIVASISSLKNGAKIKDLKQHISKPGDNPDRKRSPKEPGQDWFQPPDLN